MKETNKESNLFHYYWSYFVALIWVISLICIPVTIYNLTGQRVIEPLWIFGEFRVHLISYGDIELWFHFTVESALRLSFLGAIIPLVIALTSMSAVARHFSSRQGLVLLGTTLVTPFIMGIFGITVIIGGVNGIGAGPITMFFIFLLQVFNSWTLRNKSTIVASIIIYASVFLGLFFGDILLAFRLDGFQTMITGGLLLSDGLVWVPSFFALIFRFIHPVDLQKVSLWIRRNIRPM